MLDSIVTKRGNGYISDVIGEEYIGWSSNDLILINAPTGSGKTTFVLHELLRYAISSRKKILYLVNRKILLNQIRAEIENEVRNELYKCYGQWKNVNAYIDVVTYQSVEEKIKKGTQESLWKLDRRYQEYSYVVYDECHYFDVDSTYNTSTQLSFDFLTKCFSWKTQIYISVTMDCIRDRIVKTAYNIHNDSYIENDRWLRVTEYIVDKKYDYIYPFI